MRRAILPALFLLLGVVPLYGQYGNYGYDDASRTVTQWYEQFLNREPDPYAQGWVNALRSGQNPQQVLAGILGSDEYYRRAGGSPGAFIRQLYEDLTGRNPSPREMQHWGRQVYTRPRSDIAYAILTRHSQDWGFANRDRPWADNYDYRRPYHRYR